MAYGRRRTATCLATAALVAVSGCRFRFDELPDAEPPCVAAVAIKALDLGNDYGCAQLADDTLRCFGVNEVGQLGDGSYTSAIGDGVEPLGLGPVSTFSVGLQHACAVRAGEVYCWGRNDIGQLGVGDRVGRSTPTRVNGLPAVTDVEAGGLSTCAWIGGGALYCWGQNNGVTVGATDNPRMVLGVPPALDVAATTSGNRGSADTVCMLGTDGSTWCWGFSNDYQFGNGMDVDSTTPVPGGLGVTLRSLVAGDAHFCGLTASSEVYCWGRNVDLQAGVAGGASVTTAARVDITDVVELRANVETTCALLVDGSVKCWGDNDERELGRSGPDTHIPEPINIPPTVAFAVGSRASCAIDGNGIMRCWGADRFGERSGSTTLVRTPLSGAMRLAAGGNTTCAVTSAGAVECWGSDAHAQLGDAVQFGAPSSSPVAVPLAGSAQDISVGWFHACAALTDQTAQCWGMSESAQITFPESGEANGPTSIPVGANVLGVAAGGVQSFAITAGQPWCWGGNREGALGISAAFDISAPMMSNFPAVTRMLIGRFHSCGISPLDELWCAGRNNEFQIGTGVSGDVRMPANVLGSVTVAAAGEQFTCAATSGPMYCWGRNVEGQLGLGRSAVATMPSAAILGVPAPAQLAAGARHVCALSGSGEVHCWGNNGSGQLGDGTRTSSDTPVLATELAGATQIAAGTRHTCALFGDGTIGCIGANDLGQLGGGGAIPSTAPRQSLLTCPAP